MLGKKKLYKHFLMQVQMNFGYFDLRSIDSSMVQPKHMKVQPDCHSAKRSHKS